MSLSRIAVLALGLVRCVDAWGADGHQITGQVAMNLLSADEVTWVKGILDGQDLATVATWADKVKFSSAYRWSRELHFINVKDGQCKFDWDRDCKDPDGVAGNCAAGSILNYTQRMLHPSRADDFALPWGRVVGPSPGPSPGPTPYAPLSVKDEALRFLAHFMGDIHQPLHVSWTSDLGGNKIKVEEEFDSEKKMNLHAVWDEGIISKVEADNSFQWQGFATNLTKWVQGSSQQATGMLSAVKDWASCLGGAQPDVKACLTAIAEEGIQLACTKAYRDETNQLVTNSEELTDAYYHTRAQVVSMRLAQGGVRLAALVRYIMNAKDESLTTVIV